MPGMHLGFHRWNRELLLMTVAFVLAIGAAGCCWSYVGVVYIGSAAKTRPPASEIAGSYRVRQYGGGSVYAKWPTDLVLELREDGTMTCAGDHSLFALDFGAAESAIDPANLGRWAFCNGRDGFPVGVELTVGGVAIPSDLLRSGKRFGLGISQAWHGDPDDRNTIEFVQVPVRKP